MGHLASRSPFGENACNVWSSADSTHSRHFLTSFEGLQCKRREWHDWSLLAFVSSFRSQLRSFSRCPDPLQSDDGVLEHDPPALEVHERSPAVEIVPAESAGFSQVRRGGEQEHEEVLITVAAGFRDEALRVFKGENSWWHAYRVNGRNVLR
jgi:hypothetical protein